MSDTRIRPATPGDMDYVLGTWRKSLLPSLRGPVWVRRLAVEGINALAQNGDIRVLCLRDSPAAVLGWAAVQGDCVHWAFVKDLYRKRGFARSLVRGCDVTSQDAVRVSWLKYDPKRIGHTK